MPTDQFYITKEQLIAKYGSTVKLIKLRDLEPGTGVKIQDLFTMPGGDGVYGPTFDMAIRQNVEASIVNPAQASGAAAAYTELTSWIVSDAKQGLLQWISLASDLPDDVEWQLEIAGTIIFTGITLQNPYNIEFKGAEGNGKKLASSQQVKVSFKSGVVVVKVDATIEGVEVA